MLQKILQAREDRWNKRCVLTDRFSSVVITVTVNIPGPDKSKDQYIKAHSMLAADLERTLKESGICVRYQEIRMRYDGPEAFFVVDGDAAVLKGMAVQVEENHFLGRLADIDVMDRDKKCISRRDLGMPERQCIICGQPAHICIAGRKHSPEDVLLEIHKYLRFQGSL